MEGEKDGLYHFDEYGREATLGAVLHGSEKTHFPARCVSHSPSVITV